jgi:DNA-binding transcriptional MerR regulator
MDQASQPEAPFAVGAVARLTGLSVHVLRAWERRHGAVHPQRTPRGSRRYTEADVARLRLLRAAVSDGHPISALAPLSDASIAALLDPEADITRFPFEEVLETIARLDSRNLERLLAFQLLARGPCAFARDFVLPLFAEIGARWESGRLSIAAEHIATFAISNLLGGALRATPARRKAQPILFTTAMGERHEFGVLAAALVAANAGADAVYLGPELPARDVADATRKLNARGLAIGNAALDPSTSSAYFEALREEVDPNVSIWIGGAACAHIHPLPDGISHSDDLDTFESSIRALTPVDPAGSIARA